MSGAHLLRRGNRRLTCLCRAHSRPTLRALHVGPVHSNERQLAPSAASSSNWPSPVDESTSKGTTRKRKTESKPTKVPKPKRVPRDPLEPNSTDLYLASLRASGLEPSLEDIERMRPKTVNSTAKDYTTQYKAHLDRLLLSFSKEQLRNFTILYKLDDRLIRLNRKKVEYAESIMLEVWGWRSPADIEMEHKRATDIVMRGYPLKAYELFLLLGKDGADLLDLSLEYNVHMTVAPDPLSLRVEGTLDAMDRLTDHVSEFTKSVTTRSIEVPYQGFLDSALLQRISRLSGAFIQEKAAKGEVVISAKDSISLTNAERLAVRAAVQQKSRDQTMYALLDDKSTSFAPSQAPTYSFYPFFPPRGLPWTMDTSGAFRIRRVNEWLSENLYGAAKSFKGLSNTVIDVLAPNGNATKINELLKPGQSTSVNTETLVTASLGHILLTSKEHAQRATIFPPLEGAMSFTRLWKWLSYNKHPKTFIPSLPGPLLNTPPSEQIHLHRLVYRVITSDTVKPESSSPTTDQRILNLTATIRLEMEISSRLRRSLSEMMDQTPSLTVLSCVQGQERILDVILPDRPMDVRFTISQLASIATDSLPPQLQDYIQALDAFLGSSESIGSHPHPPLYISQNGATYVLEENAAVRRTPESRSSFLKEPHFAVRATSESVIDLETDQKSTHCTMVCEDVNSPEAWTTFLADCDTLSSLNYHPKFADRQLPIEPIE